MTHLELPAIFAKFKRRIKLVKATLNKGFRHVGGAPINNAKQKRTRSSRGRDS